MSNTIRLIAGLGNPGAQYAQTRHNVGFWLVDKLAAGCSVTFREEKKFFGEIVRISDECRLLKPSTFMNRSGQSVAAAARYHSIDSEDILVVYDDLDLPEGTVRFKKSGGHGGHNGVRDIIERLGSNNFPRLRLGIGHPGDRDQVTAYVLTRPSREQQCLLESAIDQALGLLPDILAKNYQKAMDQLNRRPASNTQ